MSVMFSICRNCLKSVVDSSLVVQCVRSGHNLSLNCSKRELTLATQCEKDGVMLCQRQI